jgi:hypothetical protein
VDAEGCFYVKISKSKLVDPSEKEKLDPNYFDVDDIKVGQIRLVFSIAQHSRDAYLLNKIIEYLNCGATNTPKTRPNETTVFVSKFSDILEKIIPFFEKHSLQGIKLLDFKDFSRVAYLLNNKSSLSSSSKKVVIEEIRSIKSRMNKGRVVDS